MRLHHHPQIASPGETWDEEQEALEETDDRPNLMNPDSTGQAGD